MDVVKVQIELKKKFSESIAAEFYFRGRCLYLIPG